MALELLNNPISTCSQKTRMCLYEKGVDFTNTKIDFRKNEHLTPEYLKLNPNGVVPTLLHDGRPVVDSSVIMEYLDEIFPEPPLSPPDPYGRAGMRAWMRYLEEVPTAAIRVPSFNKAFSRHYRDCSDEEIQSNADDRPLRRHFYKEMGKTGFSESKMTESIERLGDTISRMDRALADNAWLCGDHFTIADICVVPTVDRMRDLGLAHVWDNAPNFRRWWEAVQQRPSFARTYVVGTRVSELYEDLKEPA